MKTATAIIMAAVFLELMLISAFLIAVMKQNMPAQ